MPRRRGLVCSALGREAGREDVVTSGGRAGVSGSGEVTGGRRDKGDLARGHGAFLLEGIVEVLLVERFVLLFSC